MADSPKSVTDILDRLVDVGDKNDSVSIGDIVGTFGSRSYGPVLLVPALLGEASLHEGIGILAVCTDTISLLARW